MHYLSHSGGLDESGSIFGISKPMAQRYVKQVVKVLNVCYLHTTIRFPTSQQGWNEIAFGFERICGFPHVVGAIEGSLIAVNRFHDFEGWYCRKGFPAFKMQAVVDHRKQFMNFSIRTGSQNDKGVYNRSESSRKAPIIIPERHHFLRRCRLSIV
jgi:hypothetical protein